MPKISFMEKKNNFEISVCIPEQVKTRKNEAEIGTGTEQHYSSYSSVKWALVSKYVYISMKIQATILKGMKIHFLIEATIEFYKINHKNL